MKVCASHSQIAAFRLQRHRLLRPEGGLTPSRAAALAVGLQAQVMSSAQMAAGVRSSHLTACQVDRALWQERTLVKAWLMRGTLHLIPAGDLAHYVAALTPLAEKTEARWDRSLGGDGQVRRVVSEMVRLLDGGPMTRDQLASALESGLTGDAGNLVRHSWGGLVRLASLQGLVCFGPNRGRNITFVRTDRWLGKPLADSRQHSPSWLAEEFVRAYGPVSAHDYSHWAGVTVGEARKALESVQVRLVQVRLGERELLVREEDVDRLERAYMPEDHVALLPAFDPLVLAHKQKDHLVSPRYYKRVFRQAGWVSPVVLVSGRVVGTWSLKRWSDRIRVAISLHERPAAKVKAGLEERAASLARFWGMKEPELVLENSSGP